jgi:small conductance mechanosensitive channel
MTAADVDPAALAEACGAEPSWICEQVLVWTDSTQWAEAADFFLAKPLRIVVVVAIALAANWLVRRAIRRFAQRLTDRTAATASGADVPARAAARMRTVGAVLRSFATAAIFAIAALTVLGEIGLNLGPLIAGAGVVGIGIGFGAQSLVRDFSSGFFILIEDQYGVGDVIDIGGTSGTVEAVTLRATRFRDVDGTVWHVPNGEIRLVGNRSQQWSRAVLDIAVAHTADVKRATALLLEVAQGLRDDESWRDDLLGEPELWGIESIDATGITLRAVVKTKPAAHVRVTRELRARVRDAFEREQIPVPGHPPVAVAPPAPAPATPPG